MANQDRRLIDSKQSSTSKVPPYNDYWGRLFGGQSKLSYTAN